MDFDFVSDWWFCLTFFFFSFSVNKRCSKLSIQFELLFTLCIFNRSLFSTFLPFYFLPLDVVEQLWEDLKGSSLRVGFFLFSLHQISKVQEIL